MQIFKNLKILLSLFLLIAFVTPKANAVDECFENVSRSIHKFNMGFDEAILDPIAKGYNKLPDPIKDGTSNFTSNVATLLSIPNSLLQGNLKQAGHSTGSFMVNSTVGILGFFNPAEKMGLKPHKEDVGQTLGTYGVGPGCYLVLPILGPSTVRDSFGLIADTFVDPFAHVTIRENEMFGISGSDIDYFSVRGTTAIDFRADNDKNLESLEKNSLDLYSSLKSIYLQSRENKIKNSTEDQDDWGSLDK
jgi:phospholipid-binding lipoprotein MlaA